jgi:hypothetical protein
MMMQRGRRLLQFTPWAREITGSTLVLYWVGRSAGFAPLRIFRA